MLSVCCCAGFTPDVGHSIGGGTESTCRRRMRAMEERYNALEHEGALRHRNGWAVAPWGLLAAASWRRHKSACLTPCSSACTTRVISTSLGCDWILQRPPQLSKPCSPTGGPSSSRTTWRDEPNFRCAPTCPPRTPQICNHRRLRHLWRPGTSCSRAGVSARDVISGESGSLSACSRHTIPDMRNLVCTGERRAGGAPTWRQDPAASAPAAAAQQPLWWPPCPIPGRPAAALAPRWCWLCQKGVGVDGYQQAPSQAAQHHALSRAHTDLSAGPWAARSPCRDAWPAAQAYSPPAAAAAAAAAAWLVHGPAAAQACCPAPAPWCTRRRRRQRTERRGGAWQAGRTGPLHLLPLAAAAAAPGPGWKALQVPGCLERRQGRRRRWRLQGHRLPAAPRPPGRRRAPSCGPGMCAGSPSYVPACLHALQRGP